MPLPVAVVIGSPGSFSGSAVSMLRLEDERRGRRRGEIVGDEIVAACRCRTPRLPSVMKA